MPKKLTKEEFVYRSNIIHNHFYDYSLTKYINSITKITITCPKHGDFQQRPDIHLNKHGCPKCGKKTRTITDFIKEASKIHYDYYDYTKTVYIDSNKDVIIICPKHGEFKQRPGNHLLGKGCSVCSKNNKKNSNDFIKEANIIHNNKYDYSLVNYINSIIKVKIICKTHGIFEQIPDNHLSKKQGCPKCVGKNKSNIDFIKDAINIHNSKYDYSLVEYINALSMVKIVCPIHGIFEQIPNSHLNGSGCSKCKSSKGEEKIRKYLEENNIIFEEQKSFDDLKYKSKLLFDFYIPKHNICIEYDGIQHFKIIDHFGGRSGFMKRKHRDKIKDEYAIKNNIDLIRISYTEYNNIEKIIYNLWQRNYHKKNL